MSYEVDDAQRSWLLGRIEETLKALDTTAEENRRDRWLLGGMAHAYVEAGLRLGLFDEAMLRELVRRYAQPGDLNDDLTDLLGDGDR